MGVPGIEADHVTLVLENATPRAEVQLLHYRHPEAIADSRIRDLHKLGLNHICFATDDIESEIKKIRDNGLGHAATFWISTRGNWFFSKDRKAW